MSRWQEHEEDAAKEKTTNQKAQESYFTYGLLTEKEGMDDVTTQHLILLPVVRLGACDGVQKRRILVITQRDHRIDGEDRSDTDQQIPLRDPACERQ